VVGRARLIKRKFVAKRFSEGTNAFRVRDFERALRDFDCFGKLSILRVSCGQRVKDDWIASSGQTVSLFGELNGFWAVAN